MSEAKLNGAALDKLRAAAARAAALAMDAVKTDLVGSQTMPFDTGAMQGSLFADQFHDGNDLHTVLQTDGAQARRLYFHPEYHFQKGNNPNAGAAWYTPYLAGGARSDIIPDTFAREMKGGGA